PAPSDPPPSDHAAGGSGFVADAGGRAGSRGLPLALGGLASLGHRGAFAADGAASDGAGGWTPLSAAGRGAWGRGRGAWARRGRGSAGCSGVAARAGRWRPTTDAWSRPPSARPAWT